MVLRAQDECPDDDKKEDRGIYGARPAMINKPARPLSSAAANIATFVLQSAQLQVPLVHFSFRKCKMPLVRMEAAAWWYLGIFVRLTLVCGRVPLVHFSFRKCKMPLFRLEACGWWYLRHFVRLFFS